MTTLLVLLIVFGQNIEKLVENDPVIRVLPRDAIPAILSPAFVPALDADFMQDDEIVIGIQAGGETRAYSTWLLDHHEIVNDIIDGVPVAITWCPLCFTGITYVRKTGNETLTFAVSGLLWRENLVMYDRETRSWWAQASGMGIDGNWKGAKLDSFPSEMMTWREWRTLHPDTLVLAEPAGGARQADGSVYREYHASSRIGVTGRLRWRNGDLGPKERVITFRTESGAFAVPVRSLRETPVMNVRAGADNVTIIAFPNVSGAKVFISGSAQFSFERIERGRRIVRDSNGTEWDGYTGTLLAPAPTARRALTEVPSSLTYWFAWKTFFPEAQLITSSR